MTANSSGAVITPAPGRRPTAAPVDPPKPDHGPIRWADARRPLAAYGASVTLTIMTAYVALRSPGGVDRGRGPWPRLPGSTSGIFRVLGRWDAAWYVELSRNGYPDVAGFARDVRPGAFYPLMPALIRSVSTVTGLPAVAAGVAIALTAGAAAVLVVWQLTRELAGRVAADRAATLLAFFPASFVFAMPYTEGLAIAAAGGAILATRRQRWLIAGLLGAIAVASRPNTVVIVAALAAAAWDRPRRAWTAPAVAAGGLVVTWLIMWSRTGRVLTWIDAERIGWKEEMDMGANTIARIGRLVQTADISLRPAGLISLTITVGVVLAVIGLVTLWWWRPPWPVLIYGFGATALATASSVVGPRPRMILGAFPLIMAVGVKLHPRAYRWVLGASVLLLVAMTWVTFTTRAVAP